MKLRDIVYFFLLSLFLAGCTVQGEKFKGKTELIKEKNGAVEEKEAKKDPADMSLGEIEDELNQMEDLEIEEDLDALNDEL